MQSQFKIKLASSYPIGLGLIDIPIDQDPVSVRPQRSSVIMILTRPCLNELGITWKIKPPEAIEMLQDMPCFEMAKTLAIFKMAEVSAGITHRFNLRWKHDSLLELESRVLGTIEDNNP